MNKKKKCYRKNQEKVYLKNKSACQSPVRFKNIKGPLIFFQKNENRKKKKIKTKQNKIYRNSTVS